MRLVKTLFPIEKGVFRSRFMPPSSPCFPAPTDLANLRTAYIAQHMLGEIVSVDLPENGDTLYEGELLVRLSLSSSSLFSAPRSAVRWSRSTTLYSAPPGS